MVAIRDDPLCIPSVFCKRVEREDSIDFSIPEEAALVKQKWFW